MTGDAFRVTWWLTAVWQTCSIIRLTIRPTAVWCCVTGHLVPDVSTELSPSCSSSSRYFYRVQRWTVFNVHTGTLALPVFIHKDANPSYSSNQVCVSVKAMISWTLTIQKQQETSCVVLYYPILLSYLPSTCFPFSLTESLHICGQN